MMSDMPLTIQQDDDALKPLKLEILMAVCGLLQANYRKQLYWMSVGLVNDTLDIRWTSYTNHHSQYSACSKDGILACVPVNDDSPPPPPPCFDEHIKHPCQFRKDLTDLEIATMQEGVQSQGRLSMRLWEEHGEAPYISVTDLGIPWIVSKTRILETLREEESKDDEYAKAAKKCMPTHTVGKNPEALNATAALVPLVHSVGTDLGYIGAVVICAQEQSDIWLHLPRIKANALTLLETRRHLEHLYPNRRKNMETLLLHLLFEHFEPEMNYFWGNCDSKNCEIHKATKSRHFRECRLMNKRLGHAGDTSLFVDTPESRHLQKSLFNCGQLTKEHGHIVLEAAVNSKGVMPLDNKNVTISEIVAFIEHYWGITPVVASKDMTRCILWPTKPGVVSLLCIMEIFQAVNDDKGTPAGQLEIRLTAAQKDGQIAVHFICELSSDIASAMTLARKVAEGGGGKTTNTIIRCARGHIGSRYYYEGPAKEAIRKILDRASEPIFQPCFSFDEKNELHLIWLMPQDRSLRLDPEDAEGAQDAIA